MKIDVFTDGACSIQETNRPGGYGVVMVCKEKRITRKLSGSAINTTNNLMELEALIQGIKTILPKYSEDNTYEFFTDSSYVLLSIRNRYEYESKDFKKVKNADKLKELYGLLDTLSFSFNPENYSKTGLTTICNKNVSFTKVEGHSTSDSYEAKGNNSADALAVQAKENKTDFFDSGRISY